MGTWERGGPHECCIDTLRFVSHASVTRFSVTHELVTHPTLVTRHVGLHEYSSLMSRDRGLVIVIA